MSLPKYLLALAGILAATPALAQPAKPESCFFSTQFQNWRAADDRTLYIRVATNRYYRLDLAYKCPPVLTPDSRLITVFHGSNIICKPLDWDLKVSDDLGSFIETCNVKAMTELSPAEAAALPQKSKP